MKRFLLLISLFVTAAALQAQQVTQQQALQKARQFLSDQGRSAANLAHRSTARRAKENAGAAYYVFNIGQEEGFVIVAGDERIEPILGYTTSGTFCETDIPANMKAWLDGIATEISHIDAKGIKRAPAAQKPARPAVSPMVQVHWGQGSPYCDQCPTLDGQACNTGCMTTAMAQIMSYHKWPKQVSNPIPAYSTHNMDVPELGPTTFNWDAMPRTAYDGGDINEVAKLMRYCGQAAQTDFIPNLSSTFMGNAASALSNCFGYAKSTTYLSQKATCSLAEWEELIYNEIYNHRPVLYGASVDEFGGRVDAHAFVCDGYDGNGLFHINWGWSGNADGYFNIFYNSQGFVQSPEAVVGISPVDANLDIQFLVNTVDLSAQQTDGSNLSITFFVQNNTPEDRGVGLGIIGDGNQVIEVLGEGLLPAYKMGGVQWNFSVSGRPSGTYRVAPTSRAADGSWKCCIPRSFYVEVEAKNGTITSYTVHPVADVRIAKEDCPRAVAPDQKQLTVNTTLANHGDDFEGSLFAMVTDGVNSTYHYNGYFRLAQDATLELPIHFSLEQLPASATSFDVTLVACADWRQFVQDQSQGRVLGTIRGIEILRQKQFDLVDGEPYINDKTYEGVDVSYTRTFKNNTDWQALYLPFNLSYEEWKDKVQVAYFNNVHQYDTNGDGEIDKTTLEFFTQKSGELKPNTPYLVKPLKAGETVLSGTGKKLVAAPENEGYVDCMSTARYYTICGIYQTKTDLYEKGQFAIAGGTFRSAASASATLAPYRIYLNVEERSGQGSMHKLRAIGISVDGEETTAIGSIVADEEPAYYDLKGVRVEKPSAPGIYVSKGKKVVIRR